MDDSKVCETLPNNFCIKVGVPYPPITIRPMSLSLT